MSTGNNTRNATVLAVAAVVGVLGYWYVSTGNEAETTGGGPLVAVTVPTLGAVEQQGKRLFESSCAQCHGENAAGVDGVGPPLVHIIYEPNHHADASFLLAAANGVRAHHWTFGDMPAVEGVSEAQVLDIVAYVRALQRANGIQ